MQSVPGSQNAYRGYTIYPVNVDIASCMGAVPANPWGNPVVGHFIAMTSDSELISINSLSSLFDTYFLFDLTLFQQIIGSTIVAFALGLTAGFVVNLLRRT